MLPSNVPNITVNMLCFKSNPNSHPKKPVAKQLRFIVPLAHMRAMIA